MKKGSLTVTFLIPTICRSEISSMRSTSNIGIAMRQYLADLLDIYGGHRNEVLL